MLATEAIVRNRSALSRWHKDHASEFATILVFSPFRSA
jgi:hypothetical protein